MKPLILKSCKLCGNVFETLNAEQKFCSNQCANKFNFTLLKIEKHCPICGKSFKGTGAKKYCSKDCAKKVAYYQKRTNNTKDTICWDCKNACGGCSWSKNFTPVEGWVAEPTIIIYKLKNGTEHITESYKVIECPEFKKG